MKLIHWLVLAFVLKANQAFNLEPRIALYKKGPKGSYFGLAVSPHQILVDEHRIESTLLVGAPLDTYGTNREPGYATGVLYQCPFTSQAKDCVKVQDLPSNRDGRSLAEAAGQWLGVTVNSQGPGQQVIVCAHRYVKNETDQRWGHGQCFTLTQDLKHSATWDPCEGRLKQKAHEEWGFCQAGTSALITEDQTALIGAPGPYIWRGTVFAVSIEDDYLFRDKTHYYIPVIRGESPVDKYAYLGMSLASGNFLPTSKTCGHRLSYAVGAPRAQDVGAVFFFFKCKYERMRVDQSIQGEKFASSFGYSLAAVDFNGDGYKDLVVGAPFYNSQGAAYIYMNTKDKGIHADHSVKFKLVGKEAEGRFGFSMSHAGDLNNDGYDDVVIGAPYDGHGKVFVFLGGENFAPERPDQILEAEDLPLMGIKTFGYSLGGGGYDLDLNNHSDIVVGAFGSDTAFVIRSRPVIDIATYFKERRTNYIDPSLLGCETNPYSKEFCFTIESCFLIKNFPHNIASIHLSYSLSAEVFPGGRRVSRIRFGDSQSNATHISEKTVVVERNKLTGCFHETAYLKEGTADLRTPVMFQLNFKLQQDEPRPHSNSLGGAVSNINYFPILNQQEASKQLKVKFQESCGHDEVCSSRLRAAMSLGPGYADGRLEIQYRQEIQLNVTVSNLNGEPAYSAELQVNIDPSFAYVGRSDDVSDIHCDFRGQSSSLQCRLGNPYPSNRSDVLLFRVVPSQSSPFVQTGATFSVIANTSSEDVGQDRDRQQELQVAVIKRAEMSMRSLLQPDQIWYGGLVRSEAAMRIMSDIGSKLTHTFQVTNDGPWHVEDFNILIEWPHLLLKEGSGKRLLYLTDMPEITPRGIGECYVNPKHINALGLRDAIRRPPLYTNRRPPRPYKEDKLVITQRRKKRKRKRRSLLQDSNNVNNNVISDTSWTSSVVMASEANIKTASAYSSEADIILDCANEKIVQCHIFTCRIHGGLRANESAVVRLRSRVWNSTLVEEFGAAASTVAIHAKAHLELPEELDQSILVDDTTLATLMAFPDASVLGEGSGLETVPTWIIVVSVLVGLVVVSLIAGTLYKLGFFQRNRVPEDVMISAKVTSSLHHNGHHHHSNGNGNGTSRIDDYIS